MSECLMCVHKCGVTESLTHLWLPVGLIVILPIVFDVVL